MKKEGPSGTKRRGATGLAGRFRDQPTPIERPKIVEKDRSESGGEQAAIEKRKARERAAARAYRARHPDRAAARNRAWNQRNGEKRRAHTLAKAIPRPDRCQRCGEPHGRIHRHHPDYGQPLKVEFLCPACHALAHKALCRPPPRRWRLVLENGTSIPTALGLESRR